MRHTGRLKIKQMQEIFLYFRPPFGHACSSDPTDLNSQGPPAQTIHQTSQDSVTHSAVQMRYSGSSLVVRIPLPASLVSYSTVLCYQLCLCCSSNLRQQRELSVPGSLITILPFHSFSILDDFSSFSGSSSRLGPSRFFSFPSAGGEHSHCL